MGVLTGHRCICGRCPEHEPPAPPKDFDYWASTIGHKLLHPDALDNPDYPKAPKESYFDLAEAVDRSSIMAVSLEDAHRRNDLALLERFASTTVILGVVAIARSQVESTDEVRAHLTEALEHIEAERLIAAPDCGLGLLGRERTLAKLRILCEAAHSM